MREREANSKYFWELNGALTLYAIILFGSIWLAKRLEPSLVRTALLIAPMLPIVLAIWVMVRHFRRMDEYARLKSLEAIAISAAFTAGWTLTYGFLENAGFPKLSMGVVWPVMGAVWGTVVCLHRFIR